MEGQEEKALDKILSNDELRALFELMDSPAWYLLEKINKIMQEDWIEQTANANWSDADDKEMIRKLRHRQGRIQGVALFFAYLKKKKTSLANKV